MATKEPRGPTIYDVAREAGVAPSTVSRAFARPGRVSSATAERVREAAARLGYRANPVARAFSTGRTSMVGVLVTDVTNPFYFPIIRGAEAAASEAGFTMVLADSMESGRLERQVLDRTLAVVDGLVLASTRMPDSAIRTLAKQRPLVVLNRRVQDVPCVVTDIPRGVRRAVEHLGALGHQSVTYLAGPEASWTDGMRWRSLQEAGIELEVKVSRVGPWPPTVSGGMRAAGELTAHLPTAVLAYNDLLAIGVLRGLAEAGVRVPDEVSVVGFDNTFGADLVTPGLTTVAAPLRALGETAMHNLLAIVAGARPRNDQPITMPTRLVIRESTGQRRRKSTSPALGTTKVSGSAS